MERRATSRTRTIHRPALVMTPDHLQYVVMRDISDQGARFERGRPLEPGQKVCVMYGNSPPIAAQVVWSEGGSFGIAFEAGEGSWEDENYNPYRTVRIPIRPEAEIFCRGQRFKVRLKNISQAGACVQSPPLFDPGSLVTVRTLGREFALTNVRWNAEESFGLRWEQRLGYDDMADLLRRYQQAPAQNIGATTKQVAAA